MADPTEQTSLLQSASDENGNGSVMQSTLEQAGASPGAADDGSVGTSSTTNDTNQRLWEEMDRPWPSTFERSVALLSSPYLRAQQVAKFTKSPKPGSTPIALARRRNFERGFYTPETGPTMMGRRSESVDNEMQSSFRMGISKLHSLDFWKSKGSKIQDVENARQDKAAKAKEYRQKLLQKQAKDEEALGSAGGKGRGDAHGGPAIEASATFSQCVFNLANILMGMGLLGLPYAFMVAGWYGGGVSLLIFGAIAWRTSILIGRELNGDPRPTSFFTDSPFKTPVVPGSSLNARMYPPISSFPDIARNTFGETGCVILSVLLYFELFSCICIFLVSIGDHLHELLPAISSTNLVVLATVVSLVPTVLLRTPALLSYFSMVGTFATVVVVLTVIAAAVLEGDMTEEVTAKQGLPDDKPHHINFRSQGLMLSLGIISYCFSGHAIVPSIYSSMRKPQDFEKMVTFTFLIVIAACLAVGVSGYHMFGSTVADQVTLSLEQNSSATKIMNALTCLMVLTAFSKLTLTMFPLALGMEEIVTPYLTSDRMVEMASMTIKVVLTILAAFVAIFFPSFSFLCALTGMICTMSVSVIFPAAAHYKMFRARLSVVEKAGDVLMVVIGFILAVVGTIMTFE